MKDKIAITIEKDILNSIDNLVLNGVGKNRSQIIESFLRKQIYQEDSIHAFIIAHDIKWDNGPYLYDIPKQLLEIDGKSVIFHQVRTMSMGGVNNITIIISKGKTSLFEKDLKGLFPHININFVEVDPNVKTGIAVREGIKSLREVKYILITNGDTYVPNLNLLDLLEYHKKNEADWTFVLKYIRTNLHKFGNVTIQGNKVSEYIEKPKSSDLFKYLTNCGWYMISKNFWDSLGYDGDWLESDLFPELPKIGNIFAYIYSNEWWHIQSMGEYDMAYN